MPRILNVTRFRFCNITISFWHHTCSHSLTEFHPHQLYQQGYPTREMSMELPARSKGKKAATLCTGTQNISNRKPTTFQRLHSPATVPTSDRHISVLNYIPYKSIPAYQHTSIPESATNLNTLVLIYPMVGSPASHRIQPLLQDLDSKNPRRSPRQSSSTLTGRMGKRNGEDEEEWYACCRLWLLALLGRCGPALVQNASVNFERYQYSQSETFKARLLGRDERSLHLGFCW